MEALRELTTTQIALIAIVALFVHALLIVLSKPLNPLWMIAAAFMFFEPISTARGLPGVEAAKLGRVYCTCLIIVVGFLFMKQYRLRPIGWAFFAFMFTYFAAGLWSPKPPQAFLFKGLYCASALGGFMIAYSLRDFTDLRRGMRLFTIPAAIFTSLMWWELLRNPAALTSFGRFMPFDMNPNRVGQVGAPLFLCLVYIMLHDRDKVWKIWAGVIGLFLSIILINTGSRGAVGMSLIGCAILGVPIVKNPKLLIGGAVTLALAVVIVGSALEANKATERLAGGDLEFGREDRWNEAIEAFMSNPFLGVGWVYTENLREGGGTRNLHDIYFQIAAETGLLGLSIFGFALLVMSVRALQMYRLVTQDPVHKPTAYLALAFACAILAHGVIESSTLMGSSINGMMLTVAFGLIDRIPEMLREERAAIEAADHDALWDDDVGWDEPAPGDEEHAAHDDAHALAQRHPDGPAGEPTDERHGH